MLDVEPDHQRLERPMIKACCSTAFLALLFVSSALADDYSPPVVDPGAASAEITKFLADARPDDAIAALARDLPPTPSTQFNYEQLKSGFKLLTKNGNADVEDVTLDRQYGQSVHIITDYLHFPHADVPINQFLFLKYTFLKTGDGWKMTNFDMKTSPVFPQPGWSN
jgi:hypothetical protein